MMMGCDHRDHTCQQSCRLPQCLMHGESSFSTAPIGEMNNESFTMYPFGEECKTKWWPVSKAAYGTVFSTHGREGLHQPFILPAMDPTTGVLDNEMQMILPFIYNCTGHLCRPGINPGPVYVNPKQYHCILRRRIQRAKLMKSNRGLFVRKKYLHESRHRHATKRLRNAHGRFISKSVKAEMETEPEPTTSSDQAKSDNFGI